MLKLKSWVNIEKLVGLGFVSYKQGRHHTNYYFAVKRSKRVIIVNDVTREVVVDDICEGEDTRLHARIKYQPKNACIEDGIYELAAAGLVERV